MAGPEAESPRRLSPEETAIARCIEEARQQVPAFIESHNLLGEFKLDINDQNSGNQKLIKFLESCVVEHLLFAKFCLAKKGHVATARLAFLSQAGDNQSVFTDSFRIVGKTRDKASDISFHMLGLNHEILMKSSKRS